MTVTGPARQGEGPIPERKVNWRGCGALVLEALRQAGLARRAVVVLIGSYAREVSSWRSDIDILVLLPESRVTRLKPPFGAHLHVETAERFARKLDEGDDFAISAVRYGQLLYDKSGFWAKLRDRLEHAKWPGWLDKIAHAKRRLAIGDKCLEMGDYDAAAEEYLFAATQLARAVLLRQRIYPLSRPELSEQLAGIGWADLASDLQDLLHLDLKEAELRRISESLKRSLDDLVGGKSGMDANMKDKEMFPPRFAWDELSPELKVYSQPQTHPDGATAEEIARDLLKNGLAVGDLASVTNRVEELLAGITREGSHRRVERGPGGRYRVVCP